MFEIKSRLFIAYLVNAQHTNYLKKTVVVLIYGHVDILWTYQGAKINMMILA